MFNGYKGRYQVRNYKKYIGDPSKVVFRSLWERKVMVYFDTRKEIHRWSSEEIAIPYRNPYDGKLHRYFPDFYCERLDPTTGKIIKEVIEVKPKIQTQPPKSKGKKFLIERKTYIINQTKWEAANDWCIDKGYEFRIFTEDQIRPAGRKTKRK
tara:strand:- start:179 stop:637 length:459 start_codon:yes stop_codon:yes gene_type:complete